MKPAAGFDPPPGVRAGRGAAGLRPHRSVLLLRGYAQRAAEQAFDRLLAASALTIAGSVQIEDDGVTVEPPVSSLAMLSGSERCSTRHWPRTAG